MRVAELLEQAEANTRSRSSGMALGDGAILYREAFERHGVRVAEDGSALTVSRHTRSASWVSEASRGRRSLPDYRRRPDAEIAL